MSEKKTYTAPELIVHGDVEEITQSAGTVFPADVPHGHINTAYPLS